MEGALVSAKRDGSNMTVSVMSNAAGVYVFPEGSSRARRLRHHDSCRRLHGSWPAKTLALREGRTTANANLSSQPASLLEEALQLTSAEWLHSYPLPEK